MKKDRFSRRALLRHLGVSAAMLPLISTERQRFATAAGNPKRLITIAWGHGVVGETFYPPGDELVFGETISPLEPFKSKVLIPAGVDVSVLLNKNARFEGHFSYPCLLTGTYAEPGSAKPSGPSVDTVISAFIAKQTTLPVPVLNLGIKPASDGTSYRGTGLRNVQETDPYRLFDKLFAGKSLPTGQFDTIRARRKSVLDYVGKELMGFGTRLGTDDRMKIDAHLESIRDLEKQLTAAGSSGGTTCAAPMLGAKATLDVPTRCKLMMNLIAVTVRCDLTRVITLDIYDNEGVPGNTFPWLNITRDYHDLAHAGVAGHPQKIQIDKWLYTQVASLCKQLDETAEVGGTALDNSTVLVMNDMADGTSHEVMGIPFMMVGSCGGYFKTGRIVRLGDWAGKSGSYWTKDAKVPHNKLLATLCNAMGMNVTTFGQSGFEGTLPQLTTAG